MSRIKSLLFLLLVGLAVQVSHAAITVTYAVGTCKPNLNSFSTISAALAAMPPPLVVLVCPGTYNEQVVITQPVTLEGISSGNSAQAVLATPAGGLVQNVIDDFGNQDAAQVWVNNAAGPVNLSNLTVDGSSSGSPSGSIVGVFYQNSPGTVKKITTRNQSNGGLGVWLEGGSANPSVTVENSDMHDFGFAGIFTETNSSSSELTVTIKANNVSGGLVGINTGAGSTDLVVGNSVTGASTGISTTPGETGSVSGNTVTNAAVGILSQGDGVPVIANRILNSSLEGILLLFTSPLVEANTIIGANVGIEFECVVTSSVHKNTIVDAVTGMNDVPSGTVSINTYINVGTIRSASGC